MLLSFFSGLYETLAGPNNEVPEYRDGIFSSVGMLTIIIVLAIAAVFYLLLGRWRTIFHRLPHWIITLVAVAIFGFSFAFAQASGSIGSSDSYTTRFALVNALLAMVYFFLFSILLKKFSIYAKRTPF